MRRLDLIVSLIDVGARIADIGCDHAYVTIAALEKGAEFAYASDVREGPLSRAKENIKSAGFEEKSVTALADGLDGAEKYAPDTVIIAGMGGELIARIINDAPFLKENSVKLILQPMTSQYELRKYLCENGFEIKSEHLSEEDGRLYQIIVCAYSGKSQIYSDTELEAGKNHVEKEYVKPLYEKYIRKYKKIINGKKQSGADTSYEEKILKELSEKYEND